MIQDLILPLSDQGSLPISQVAERVECEGFKGDELFSKDELNLILDLEDESSRMGDFRRIHPMKETANEYYLLMEERRY